MYRTILALSVFMVGCDLATTPESVHDSRQWIFQMPMVHATDDTLPQPEYLFCADSLAKGTLCTFQGIQGTIDYAADWIYLDTPDSSIQWPNRPLFVGRK